MNSSLPPSFNRVFESLETAPIVKTDSVNKQEFSQMVDLLESSVGGQGEFVLLKTPRAGYGKTHLLESVRQKVLATHQFVMLEPTAGKALDSEFVLSAIIDKLLATDSGVENLSTMDVLCRKVLAKGLMPLIESGSVPSDDANESMLLLMQQPLETFDFNDEDEVTAQWAKKNFKQLLPKLTSALSDGYQLDPRLLSWWLALLFEYGSGSMEGPERDIALWKKVFGGDVTDSIMKKRLVSFVNILSVIICPVIVIDDVEGYFANPEEALKLSVFINSLHESCEKLTIVMSVNSDVWETAFLPRLSGGLKDRLMQQVVTLSPLSHSSAVDLIRDRAGVHTDAILDELDLNSGALYARGVVQKAREAWLRLGLQAKVEKEVELTDMKKPVPIDMHQPISLLAPEPKEEKEVEEPEPQASSHLPPARSKVPASNDEASFKETLEAVMDLKSREAVPKPLFKKVKKRRASGEVTY